MPQKRTSSPANQQKKELAEQYFTRGGLSQKETAAKVGVTPKTMSNWVEEGNWNMKRKTLMITRQEQLALLYEILDGLNREGKESLQDDDPNTNPDADRIIKITAAIRKLENETGIGEMIDTLKALISFTIEQDFEASKVINKWGDMFIKDRLSSIKN